MERLCDFLLDSGCAIINIFATGSEVSVIVGKCQGDRFVMEYKPKHSLKLNLDITPRLEATEATLIAICTTYMGVEAACRYNIEVPMTPIVMRVIEWRLQDIDDFLRAIVNGGEAQEYVPVKGLKLFGEHHMSDYEDTDLKAVYEELRLARTKFAGYFGKDPGNCQDAARVKRMNNLELYLSLTTAVEKLDRFQKHPSDISLTIVEAAFVRLQSGLSAVEYTKMQYMLAIDFILGVICERNQITLLAEPSRTEHLRFDQEAFNQWAGFYDQCADQPEAERQEMYEKFCAGKDISEYIPPGDWRDFHPNSEAT